ncbi:MAG: hypothetical protein JO193_05135 [Candidatus Eremiobacteraeota bacterium]|nr:hypothetical protein [Candidatus Eremiobacteraeota bacterium]MBV9972892.1 hypothetical protein [Candidatus Eremiobacteraeota bacterium]
MRQTYFVKTSTTLALAATVALSACSHGSVGAVPASQGGQPVAPSPPSNFDGASGASTDSQYLQTAADISVSGAPTPILTATVAGGRSVYLQSDGRFYPTSPCIAYLYITVDGVKVTDDSLIDWTASTNRQQHSFDVIGAAALSPGNHTITLTAQGSGSFVVGAPTSLSILINTGTTIKKYALSSDTGVLSFNTAGIQEGQPLPRISFGSIAALVATGQPVVAALSGRTYNGGYNCCYGDPLWNISIDGQAERNAYSDWTDNDIFTGAELQAPMFSHAYFDGLASGYHTLSADASALPYTPPLVDTVQYRIGAGTQLIVLWGGMAVSGRGTLVNDQYHRLDYICVGSSSGSPGCPSVNTDVTIATFSITVPSTDSGVVFLTAKSRVQGDSSDAGGTVSFWIDVDGVERGSLGVQQLQYPNSVSTRTISASYLATGANRLAAGNHQISVHAKVTGSFVHLSLTKDLPLIWFD